jgi:hypothetical protein
MGTKLNLYGFYTRDEYDAQLLNTTGGNAEPWNARTLDRINTYGLGLSTVISERSNLSVDYISSVAKGEITVQTTALEAPFEPLRTNLQNLRVHFDYKINDRWGYKLYAEQEDYSSADWTIDGYDAGGINSILSMGEVSPNYKVWYYRLQFSYKF